MLLTTLYSLITICVVPFVMAQTKLEINLTELRYGVRYDLECNPTHGEDYPDPDVVCDFVYFLNGDFDQAKSSGRKCSREYFPFSVLILGEYEGERISYYRLFSNQCQARDFFDILFPFPEGELPRQ
ncbi:uncharacterized protein B0P05DRAFT_558306 [Gilbertella persicaria]|uniref:uncharacterized protein n=1 Tax=Gilbertella persicaria TaxID=101096 RepID=UPI0022202F26|nr:uncharacterized protein B0P05DRAFT_558306 [Gilbertella persicaria]KAI8059986.1 hypothetical protein B0P05DRAFT_558306 [Gilbertella persicaria]